MISILSLITSVKDYYEVIHKFIEYDSVNINYAELGSIVTYFLISIKNSFIDFLSFSWLFKENIWSLPIIIPEISSAMISEISVLNGYFHNAFNFLDTPLSYNVISNEQNSFIACIEKFIIGGINSFFLFLPTSTAHIITLRRFVMQGLEAGYISGLGTIAGNVFWLGSVILGFRFFVIPWLSLDIFRYLLGFILLVKYMWDSYNEKKLISNTENTFKSGVSETNSTSLKTKMFLLNFLLALTEQTSIYPFISNISVNPETSILESFSLTGIQLGVGNSSMFEGSFFVALHLAYLLGITLGSLSLLHLSCWFWENPAFKLYMWVISSFKVSTGFYYKTLNFVFLYLTMLSAVCSIPYYGLDYTVTNPLGFVNDDRLIQDKTILETSFLGTKASDRNTRRNRGRHGRRERWKRRIRKYRTFDASLYDQGIYDLFTVEDLNYGFDRFWLRRKLRNHRVRFRFFPGPWMRSFKKQLAKPRLESYTGPRVEFFRILYEQVYHPSFHAYNTNTNTKIDSSNINRKNLTLEELSTSLSNKTPSSIFLKRDPRLVLQSDSTSTEVGNLGNSQTNKLLKLQRSTIRKFIRKFDNRLKTSQINRNSYNNSNLLNKPLLNLNQKKTTWVLNSNELNKFSNYNLKENSSTLKYQNDFNLNSITNFSQQKSVRTLDSLDEKEKNTLFQNSGEYLNLKNKKINLTKKDLLVLQYRSLLTQSSLKTNTTNNTNTNTNTNTDVVDKSLMLLHPLKFYLQQDTAFKRKLRYYTPSVYRKFSVENNAPYYRVMMKRYFYNYKPTLRWERTMKAATLRKARRKTTRNPRKLQKTDLSLSLTSQNLNTLSSTSSPTTKSEFDSLNEDGILKENNLLIPLEKSSLQKSSYNYSVVSKRASRYRYQIYKDVLQHWYYSPFNRLLLKLDVDNFIKRQPNAHFLTTKEENLLHLRRFLLFEHYNTLRWYTNMQHYRSMKTQLNGGTKSFSSRPYNQQFSGTFKKIRHLFAITPSISTVSNLTLSGNSDLKTKSEKGQQEPDNDLQPNVLKFDQLLYNEYPNTKENPLLNPLVIHEELLPDYINDTQSPTDNNLMLTSPNNSDNNSSVLRGDIISQSQGIVRNYLMETRSIREDYIKKLLNENNYSTLTQFIYKGQKVRGTEPVTNQKALNTQEKEYLLSLSEQNEIEKELMKLSLPNISAGSDSPLKNNGNLSEQLYLTYLKNWKRRVLDQESLKNYLSYRLDKREKRKLRKEKQLLTKIKRLEDWYSLGTNTSNNTNINSNSLYQNSSISLNETKGNDARSNSISTDLLTSGLQKSILEGMYTLNNIDQKVVSSSETNLWKLLLLSKIKQKQNLNNIDSNYSDSNKTTNSTFITKSNSFNRLQDITLSFNDLEKAKKNQLSNDIKSTVKAITRIVKNTSTNELDNGALKKSNMSIYSSVQDKLKNYSDLTLRNIFTAKNTLFNITKLTVSKVTSKVNLFKPLKRKNVKSLKDWRKKERVLGKQKRSRKEFKLLNKKTELVSSFIDNDELELALQSANRKKRSNDEINSVSFRDEKDTQFRTEITNNPKYIPNMFKRKRSAQRRSRIRRNRGVFKKRTLVDSLRKDFIQFSTVSSGNIQNNFISKFNNDLYNISSPTENQQNPLKQRKSKIRKERYWKQKRSKYSQKRRKYRKRRRYTIVKIRNLNKQFKRVKNQLNVQNWWWKQFIPSIQASNDVLWQIERDKLIQQKLSQLTTSEILERDNLNNTNFDTLQIGNKDFKPLALPQAIRLYELAKTQQQNNSLSFKNDTNKLEINDPINQSIQNKDNADSSAYLSNNNFNTINQLYKSLFINENDNKSNVSLNEFLVPNTNLPFYAGWDESLRKLIVTNRMLSRKDAGFTLYQNNEANQINSFYNNTPDLETNSFAEFTSAPLQGMNAATTLYWQIPFTTYDPDQFFALGMDGFSPIGWRKFLFRHSILKTWLDLRDSSSKNKQNAYNNLNLQENKPVNLIVKKQANIINDLSKFGINKLPNIEYTNIKSNFVKSNKIAFATSRRLKKRYRRVKKHPRTPVWFPSGPLTNQVLPVHYIYVFYKRSRLPRDRYLKRRLLNVKNQNTTFVNNFMINNLQTNNSFNYDFTLRKRLKPKRKYHLKRDYYASNVVLPRRLKFMSSPSNQSNKDLQMWRPLSTLKIHKPISDVVKEQFLLRRSALQKQRSSKQQPNMRVKQLRRRVQRQILRTVWRYRPRAGGFVWPGDYLKLELVKAPKLQVNTNSGNENTNAAKLTNRKQKRKKKRNLVEWQTQPKTYLYQKHNLNVLKKKIKKAQRATGSYTNTLNTLRNYI